MTEDRGQHRQRLLGIALMCGAIACFSCIDTTAKYLITRMDPLEVAWARYAGGFGLAFLFSNTLTRPGLIITRRPWLQLGRSALLLGSTVLGFFGIG